MTMTMTMNVKSLLTMCLLAVLAGDCVAFVPATRALHTTAPAHAHARAPRGGRLQMVLGAAGAGGAPMGGFDGAAAAASVAQSVAMMVADVTPEQTAAAVAELPPPYLPVAFSLAVLVGTGLLQLSLGT